jgi:LuxR family maltose regulon positive regulatory protein
MRTDPQNEPFTAGVGSPKRNGREAPKAGHPSIRMKARQGAEAVPDARLRIAATGGRLTFMREGTNSRPSRGLVGSANRSPERIRRTALVERLTTSRTPVTVIEAPAGYGKTELAATWIRHERRRTEWISIGDGDADALAAAEGVVSESDPVVIVLDNVEKVRGVDAWARVGSLLDAMPDGSCLALVGRNAPLGSLARLRTDGAVTDVGVRDLQMQEQEIDALVRALGLVREPDTVQRVLRRTEGWPAAVALSLRSHGGDDRLLDDYVRTEILATLTKTQRRFLARASVLDWLSVELCDAALPSTASAQTIRELQASAVPLFPLEGRRWRLHPVVREVLRLELEAHEPEAVARIARAGSVWCEQSGFLGTAISLAQSAGDIDRVATLTVRSALTGSWLGALHEIHRRLGWIKERAPLERYPFAAAIGAWIHINTGNATVADRLTEAAARGPLDETGPDGSPLRAWVRLLRAALARDGVEQSRADAMWAIEELAPGSSWRALAWLIFGIGCAVVGDWDEADMALADAGAEAGEDGSLLALTVALGEHALVAIHLDRWSDANTLATRSLEVLGRGGDSGWAGGAARVAAALVAVHRGDVSTARTHLEDLGRALAHLTRAVPAISVQVRLEAARAYLALEDAPAARTVLDEADEVLRRFPKMRELAAASDELRGQLRRRTDPSVRLTNAELRLLPLLATHKTFQAIADELFLSPHTVKAEAISIYRKLGQTSRGTTIARAREIGLIQP